MEIIYTVNFVEAKELHWGYFRWGLLFKAVFDM